MERILLLILIISVLSCTGCQGTPGFNEVYAKAERGDAQAQLQIGHDYFNGVQTEQSYVDALNWIEKSAQQGFVPAERQLAYMYRDGQGVQTNKDKAFEWFSKAAAQGDADSKANLAWMYQVGNPVPRNQQKAFELYKSAAEQGDKYSKVHYAQLLISGDAGVFDIQKGISVLKEVISKGDYHYFSEFHDSLYELDNLPGINIYPDMLYWFQYFADNYIDISKNCCHEDKMTKSKIYFHLAGYYAYYLPDKNDYVYGSSADADKMIDAAEKYYLLSRDEAKIAEVSAYKKRVKNNTLKDDTSLPSICDAIFSHRQEDFDNYKQTQDKIFSDKGAYQSVISEYRRLNIKKYQLTDDQHSSMYFIDIPIIDLLHIYFDLFVEQTNKYRESSMGADKNLQDLSIMARYTDEYFPIAMNLLLAKYKINTTCSGNKVYFSLSDPVVSSKLFTTHFITDWSGNVALTDSLNGNGSIHWENEFSFSGEIKNNLPNGAGKYAMGNDQLIGDGFINGILTGSGELSVKGKAVYRGEYKNNQEFGYGKIGYGYGGGCSYIYEGQMNNSPSGKGKITYISKANNFWAPIDDTYPILWTYTGGFQDGKKHGVGTCELYRNGLVVDSFACEFYKDSLIKIGDVSLLPPSVDYTTIFNATY